MKDLFTEIWSSLRQNKLRTALTGFAVAWGLFMLIALLGAGNGLLNAVMDNSGSLDHSMMIYSGYTSKSYNGFDKWRRISLDKRDVDILGEGRFGDIVEEVSPNVSQYDTLVFRDRSFQASLRGVMPVYEKIQNIKMAAGRFVNLQDNKDLRKYVIISSAEVEDLLGKNTPYSAMLGKDVKIGPFSWRVIGVYKADESEGGGSPELYAPYSSVSMVYNTGTEIQSISLSFHGLETDEESDAFENAYRRIVNEHHYAAPDDKRTVYIWNRLSSTRQMGKVERIIRTALWILGLFTLLSGIVGVSNIMLITVKERTHEFGIRKAIGASPSSILRLIITESIIITAFFGYIGMIMGLAANEIMDTTLAQTPVDVGIAQVRIFMNPRVGMDVAVKATLVLILAGTIAGLIPAWKASKVKPIEALRAE